MLLVGNVGNTSYTGNSKQDVDCRIDDSVGVNRRFEMFVDCRLVGRIVGWSIRSYHGREPARTRPIVAVSPCLSLSVSPFFIVSELPQVDSVLRI